MKIEKIRIRNFRGFRDSGDIRLGSGFNVIVGKNNSGKTAFINAFRLHQAEIRPHRSATNEVDAPLDNICRFDVVALISPEELRYELLGKHNNIHFPVPNASNESELYENGRKLVRRVFYDQATKIGTFIHAGDPAPKYEEYPSHRLFKAQDQKYSLQLTPNPTKSGLKDVLSNGAADSFFQLWPALFAEKIFVFRAERMNVSRHAAISGTKLNDGAQNLAQVLGTLQGEDPPGFEQFNDLVRQVFPDIGRIAVALDGDTFEIRVWHVGGRPDLAISLAECGTGVAQVLSILYVASRMRGSVIAIDEPNAFLHPGASRRLIEILKTYGHHQYILSTHSSEIISSADPSTLYTSVWENGEIKFVEKDPKSIDDKRFVLAELGVSLVDVLGADKVVWVEGPTEAKCFPLILAAGNKNRRDPALDFVPIRSVDEVVGTRKVHDLALDIYERLTSAGLQLAVTVRFSFDRETRTNDQIEKIKAFAPHKIRFIPARCFESFLLQPKALTSVLIAEAATYGVDQPGEERVIDWLDKNAGLFADRAIGNWKDPEWKKTANVPSLLQSMFQALIKTDYAKIKHGAMLTIWLLDNEPEALKELSDYVLELVKTE